MHRALVLTLSSLVLLSTAATAGNASDPEVRDGGGDVRAQHALDAAPPEDVPADIPAAEISAVGDILSAWVGPETDRAFTLWVKLADMPDVSPNVTTSIAEVWMHMRIKGEPYRAVALLSVAADTGELSSRGELYKDNAHRGAVQTVVDKQTKTINFIVEKSLTGNPGFGDKLTDFFVTTHLPHGTVTLDYAPHARAIDPAKFDPLNLATLGATPTYGRDYLFGDFAGAVASDLSVTLSPPSLTLQSGAQGSLSVSLKNQAAATDTATLSVSNAPPGWSVRLDASSVVLEPGKARLTFLHVVPPATAQGQSLVLLRVLSDLGADEEVAISVQVTPSQTGSTVGAGASAGATGSTAGSTPSPSGGADEVPPSPPVREATADEGEENGAPAPGLLALLAVIGLAALARRRQT